MERPQGRHSSTQMLVIDFLFKVFCDKKKSANFATKKNALVVVDLLADSYLYMKLAN